MYCEVICISTIKIKSSQMDPVSNAYHKAHLFKKTLLIAFCILTKEQGEVLGMQAARCGTCPSATCLAYLHIHSAPLFIYGSVYWTFA